MALKGRSEGKFSQWTKVRTYIDSSADGLVGWPKFRRIMIGKLVARSENEVCGQNSLNVNMVLRYSVYVKTS